MNEKTKETRTHNQIDLAIFGRTHEGKVDKSIIHTLTLFTGLNAEGLIESVRDRINRFINECSDEGAMGGPAYQITNVTPVY